MWRGETVTKFILSVVLATAGLIVRADGSFAQDEMFEPIPTGPAPAPVCGDACDCPDCHSEYPVGEGWGAGLTWMLRPSLFDFKHSSTHGRWSGKGQPLHGTSWLNRPYEFGLETGALVMTGRVASHVRNNNDLLGAMHLGWDWDHYWGTQIRLAYTSPQLGSGTLSESPLSNDFFMYDISLLYYPWGDSRVRPYYRAGLGLTDFDYINDDDLRQDATLFTMPFAIGIKYQTKRWMACRFEVADYLAFGQNGTRTLNNFTITAGFEWRLGGKPQRRWTSPAAAQVW